MQKPKETNNEWKTPEWLNNFHDWIARPTNEEEKEMEYHGYV